MEALSAFETLDYIYIEIIEKPYFFSPCLNGVGDFGTDIDTKQYFAPWLLLRKKSFSKLLILSDTDKLQVFQTLELAKEFQFFLITEEVFL